MVTKIKINILLTELTSHINCLYKILKLSTFNMSKWQSAIIFVVLALIGKTIFKFENEKYTLCTRSICRVLDPRLQINKEEKRGKNSLEIQSTLVISTTFYLDLSVSRPIFVGPLGIATSRRQKHAR